MWRSVVVIVCELLVVVNELRPITATTAIAIPAKNFFVFIIVCAKFVSHPTFDYMNLICLYIDAFKRTKVSKDLPLLNCG